MNTVNIILIVLIVIFSLGIMGLLFALFGGAGPVTVAVSDGNEGYGNAQVTASASLPAVSSAPLPPSGVDQSILPVPTVDLAQTSLANISRKASTGSRKSRRSRKSA
jgi:flagellar basal body-associated protein FliL